MTSPFWHFRRWTNERTRFIKFRLLLTLLELFRDGWATQYCWPCRCDRIIQNATIKKMPGMRNTPALTHRGISSFGLVTPRVSVREKQKPRDLHREAVTRNRQPKNLIIGLASSILILSLQKEVYREKTGAEPCGSAPDYLACPASSMQ